MDYGRLEYAHLIPLFSDSMYQPAETAERPQQDTVDSQDVTEALTAFVIESLGVSGLQKQICIAFTSNIRPAADASL
jgi:hypothetical protein